MLKLAIVGSILGFASVASAAACTYTSSTDAWGTPANWSCTAVPGASDDVTINGNDVSAPDGTQVHSVTITANELTLLGTLTTGDFAMSGGSLGGSGRVLKASGAVSVTGGGFSAIPTIEILSGGHGSIFLPPVDVSYADLTVDASGSVTILRARLFDLVNHGTLEVQAGSVLDAFTNDGTLTKTTAGILASSNVSNTGTVTLANGIWESDPTAIYSQSAGTTTLAGGVLSFAGPSDAGVKISGGTLTGSGLVEGSVLLSGGTIEPGGVGAIGTIAFGVARGASNGFSQPWGGTFTQTGGTLHIERAGTLPGIGYDRVVAAGAYKITAGTLQVDDLASFAPAASDGFEVLEALRMDSNSGTFTTSTLAATYNPGGITVGGATVRNDFQIGDFFVGDVAGIERVSAAGDVLDYYPQGMNEQIYGVLPCFDSAGNFYLPHAAAHTVAKYDKTGTLVSASFFDGTAAAATPIACVVTKTDSVFVITVDLTAFALDSTGAIAKSLSFTPLTNGAVALLGDGCTVVSANGSLAAYNLCTDTAVTTYNGFAITDCTAIAAHPDGDIFVACGDTSADKAVYRLHGASVTPAQTYSAASMNLGYVEANTLYALALDPSGTSFWVSARAEPQSAVPADVIPTTMRLTQVDIATGAVLEQIVTPSLDPSSLVIYGTVASAPATGGGSSGGTSAGSTSGDTTAPITPTTPTTTPPPTPKKGCNGSGGTSLSAALAIAWMWLRKRA